MRFRLAAMLLIAAGRAFAMEAKVAQPPALVPALTAPAIAAAPAVPTQLTLFELPPAAVTVRMTPVSAPDMISSFSQNWKLGQDWEAPQPADEGARRVAEALAQAARMANEAHEAAKADHLSLMSGMAHDLNNGLMATVGWTGLLAETGAPKRYVDALSRSNTTLQDTIKTYSKLAAANSGKLSVHERPLRAVDLIETAARKAQSQAESKGIQLTFTNTDAVVSADQDVVAIVLANLVGNALKYTPREGRVEVFASKEGERVRFTIKDNGIGIAAEDQPRVLQGHRTDSGRKMAQGTGFGLPFVAKLLAAHGSRLELDSAPGQGSAFSFTLPSHP